MAAAPAGRRSYTHHQIAHSHRLYILRYISAGTVEKSEHVLAFAASEVLHARRQPAGERSASNDRQSYDDTLAVFGQLNNIYT